jgi:putative phosphoribosyl transferase
MRLPQSASELVFHDRAEAGKLLAKQLQAYAQRPDVIVCALPRGGVPVGVEIATALGVPISVFIVRKLGVPGHEELAMGAITSGGMRLINRSVTESLNVPASVIENMARHEMFEVLRRERLYSHGHMRDFKNKIVILTDDGIATGSTMILAAQALRQRGAQRIVAAVPVAPPETILELREIADEVICLSQPEPFVAVGAWYKNFAQLTDPEVCQILDRVLEPHLRSRTA